MLASGVRSAAFLSGGFLPPHVRGTISSKYIHVCDWWSTILGLAGIDPTDHAAAKYPFLPPIDSLDQWSALISNTSSPRTVIPLSSAHGPLDAGWGRLSKTGPCIVPGVTGSKMPGHAGIVNPRCSQGAIIVGDWKLYYGPSTNLTANLPCAFCWWSGPRSPNTTTDPSDAPFQCPPKGCLCTSIRSA